MQRKQAKNDGRLPGLFLDPTHWNLPGILEPGDTLEPGTPQAQTSQAPVVGLKRADSRALVFGLLLSAAAMVFCCILYKYGFQAWFQEDDFAWLGLRLLVHSPRDLLHVMFAPMAGGSMRTISERAFFLGFYSLFGLNALPYRLAVFATQLGNIALLSAIAQSLLKWRPAIFWAPVLWVANSALAWPLVWTAAYNEILCSFIFLLSFYALLRYTQTGSARFNYLQWIVFLIGFGVLEINVMYPLIAILYTFLFARDYLKRAMWLLAPSVIFAVIHSAVRPPAGNNVYALHFDFSAFTTLLAYWNRALGPAAAAETFPQIHFAPVILTCLLSLALLSLAIARIRHGDRLPIFFLGWFVIVLAPFLPVRNHISDYYLTVPLIGLALLGAWAIGVCSNGTVIHKTIAALAVAIYLICCVPTARKLSKSAFANSVPVKKLVTGVSSISKAHPGKIILLDGVDQNLFWNGVYDRPFRLIGSVEVYLTPETAQRIPPSPELGNVAEYTLPYTGVLSGLAQNRLLVYHVQDGELQDITAVFKPSSGSDLPRRINPGDPRMASLLGPTWHPSERNFRWMPKEATIRIGMPKNGQGELRIEAICVAAQVKTGPLTMWATIDGKKSPPALIGSCNGTVHLTFPVSVPTDRNEAEVKLELDRTFQVKPWIMRNKRDWVC